MKNKYTEAEDRESVAQIKQIITNDIQEYLPELLTKIKNIKKEETLARLYMQLFRFAIPQIKPMEIKPYSDDDIEDWFQDIMGKNSNQNDSKIK